MKDINVQINRMGDSLNSELDDERYRYLARRLDQALAIADQYRKNIRSDGQYRPFYDYEKQYSRAEYLGRRNNRRG